MLLASWYQRLLRARILNWGATPMRSRGRSLATSWSTTPRWWLRGRSRSTPRPRRSGRGLCRWALVVAARTHMTGSSVCSDWKCTAPRRSRPSSSTSRSVTCCRCARTTPGCGSRSWIPSGRFRRARRNGAWVWSFALVPDNGSTRLISRNRARVRTLGERAGMAAMEVGSLVMERKMLYGIKQRAEQGGAVDTRAPSNHK
jgi:hypothetical protein